MKIASIIFAMLFLCVAKGNAQVAVAVSPVAHQQFFSLTTGAPLASGCLFTYITGTSTPLATYTDGTGTAQNTNPVILGVDGGANLWLSNAAYRYTLYSNGGVNCATGTFQYTIDNVSAWTVINSAQDIFLLGATSDPGGTAGELAYRSDLGCFRGFSTFWDCFVTFTGVQTLTNKTINASANTILNTTNTAGHYLRNNGTQYADNVIQPADSPGVAQATGGGSGGTVLNGLAKLNGTGGFTVSATTDTGGAIGICMANCGTATPTIQEIGPALCSFDNSAVAADYVQISTTVAGDCHDSGSTYPLSGQVIGRAWTSGLGTTNVLLFGPEIRVGSGATPIFTTASASTNGSLGAITMATAGGNGNIYQFSAALVQTTAGTSCAGSTTITTQVTYTDNVTGGSITVQMQGVSNSSSVVTGAPVLAASGNGAVGNNIMLFPLVLNAKASTAVTYSTIYTAGGSCSPAPQYYVQPNLIQIK